MSDSWTPREWVRCGLVDTEAELKELPDGSVIFDSDCDVVVKFAGRWHAWNSDEPGATVTLPVMVVHTPGDGWGGWDDG
jgi:hypothetical protein